MKKAAVWLPLKGYFLSNQIMHPAEQDLKFGNDNILNGAYFFVYLEHLCFL